MRVLATGGTEYDDREAVAKVIADLVDVYGTRDLMLIEGGAPGADMLVREECAKANVHCATVPALWATRHRSGGPQRNKAMIDLLEPERGVSFGGDAGTRDCVKRMTKAGIPVLEVS